MTSSISRRDFLKLGGAAAAALALPGFLSVGTAEAAGSRLGRCTRSLRYFDRPTFSGKETGYYNTDAVIEILDEEVGDPEPAHNPIWLHSKDGWVHSGYVQPVRNDLNTPTLDVKKGFLGEITVPFTTGVHTADNGKKRTARFYYGSTYWVLNAYQDQLGSYWYRLLDDLYKRTYVVQAEHVRQVLASELTPLSPDVTDKRIEVNLSKQRLTALENGKVVFMTRVSAGLGDTTPVGEFRVERKQPSRHMADRLNGGYDLPGVPYVCYIEWTGISLHGTYWHNNFGAAQSHGCINLTPAAAKLIYRWTSPILAPEEDYAESDSGTPVTVFA